MSKIFICEYFINTNIISVCGLVGDELAIEIHLSLRFHYHNID